ncbi:similar to Saccharomyces cerevisiae YHL038C CBP2 Mitochondrial protein required for splicing of the group I intron aI5 of the COB pre-mRNA, binds to the RNA to promote splicing [Maudiozyma barnettii]|uniref:Similar to Saccharomyces cerevisiae YHL038C CBP2 Mitochondrial protein required for splicing of the group I intron aI5 of the COB pre-mRNA, binds to the RNA to promote splicing n=1 Tax=Maudiozyma barnettii TaxID=61262 RepID=A0A8H2VD02_9SACH|nr:Cbp2p [Kazachstania barnettii]CAB4252989.1 similar to Saccharomyces cerevisiae YHL038C CBP2 Mitochondrial protein required for splicing of the group I intron aI5 of the COB pre-mRNA, binds to the RNA to promote splicing [Kazachstania barnettii]CAD1780159.1 similar to Saccharomyces cerevisiae YHL038C CBP2 Mitochondrial protein required for splicing of the group I intron aI5 of the COB pre-mRNA, binds to the RNA to promote splicing [Kazachstania barnettii]
MSSTGNFGPWLSYFYASLRREARARKFQYVFNIPNMKALKIQDSNSRLKLVEKNLPIPVHLETSIFNTDLSHVQNLLLADVRNQKSVKFGFQIKGIEGTVPDRGIISSILKNPVLPNYLDSGFAKEKLEKTPFEYKHTIRLDTDTNDETLHVFDRVLWPNPIFSNFCRGVGVTPKLYKELLTKDIHFRSPCNSDLLPIFKIESIPEGYDSMGLFPKFNKDQSEIFKGIDAMSALITATPCIGYQYSKVRDAITSTLSNDGLELDRIDKKDIQLFPMVSKTHSSRDTLAKLLVIAKYDTKLWSISAMTNKICPGDILRSTLFARNCNRGALRREFMKHYVSFNVVSLATRLNDHKVTKDFISDESAINWKPWDLYIWHEYEKLEKDFKIPNDFQDLQLIRHDFSGFLRRLFEYHCLVTAEMKVNGSTFFENTDEIPGSARCYAVTTLLNSILNNSKTLETLYPGLAAFIDSKLPKQSQIQKTLLPKLDDSRSLEVGERISNIIREMISFENNVFHDKFTSHSRMHSEINSPMKDWKIIILHKKPFSEEQIRTIRYQSRIFTQFTNTFESIDKISYSICVEKKMIDEDTIIYLYKMNREKKSSLYNMMAEIMKNPDIKDVPEK